MEVDMYSSATVLGKYVKPGTTGRSRFGANPHNLVA